MDDIDAWTNKLQGVRERAWELTGPVLDAFGPAGVDHDAYAHAAGAAAAEVGLAHMLWTWAALLWPTATPPEVATKWDLPAGRPWAEATGQLLDAAATYAMDPQLPHLSNTLHVAESVLSPACAGLDGLWECTFFWARALFGATAAAGGLEEVGKVDEWHRRWARDRGKTLSTPMALVVSTVAAGNTNQANAYLVSMALMGADLAKIATMWIIGLSQMVTSLDHVAVVGADGTLLSMGRIDEIPESDADLRTLALLTGDLVAGLQRGDADVFATARSRTEALTTAVVLRWCWMLASMVGGGVAQLRARHGTA